VDAWDTSDYLLNFPHLRFNGTPFSNTLLTRDENTQSAD
jgi:hypothetical protein